MLTRSKQTMGLLVTVLTLASSGCESSRAQESSANMGRSPAGISRAVRAGEIPNSAGNVANAAQPTRRSLRPDELTEARLVFDELQVRLGIASAKLDSQSVGRKREMGRLRALIDMTDQQITIQSASVQRLQEREQQVRQDLLGVDNTSTAANSQILQRAREPLQAAQQRLDRLAKLRLQLKQRLDESQRAHLQRLLEAAVIAAEPDDSEFDALEAELEAQLKLASEEKDPEC